MAALAYVGGYFVGAGISFTADNWYYVAMNKKKLYVGCAINNLSPEQRKKFFVDVSRLKDDLRAHFEVLDFVTDPTATPRDIYRRDIRECVETADFMLAICDHASTGMGYEMATAIEYKGIPVLAVAHADSSVSKLIRGIDNRGFSFKQYRDFSDILPLALEAFRP